jgi:DNA-binding beta-propeller fold protein YncE
MFPQLRKIEAKYGDRVVVVGVHSPKFPAERETANLREAVLRYHIEHPVVNDRDFQAWHAYGGRAWPTLMFVDPEGRVIGKHEGELPFEAFDPLVDRMLREFSERGLLAPGRPKLALQELKEPATTLRFPGKLLVTSDALYVSDSNHHRILACALDGTIKGAIGSGEPGLEDGTDDMASFQQPQGMAISGRSLFVADTENHAIREVDLDTGRVRTLAGTGDQAHGVGHGGPGRSTPLSSPWDLALVDGRLVIAMAGVHQLWELDRGSGEVRPCAGTGREGLKDGSLEDAWFAQPSGLALADGHLYVADSEVSAIRDVDLRRKTVTTLVGEGLFVFGDVDGGGDVVRLQHPLGITARDGRLFIADSYNNKIKQLDPGSRSVTTWVGSGSAGSADGIGPAASFREPGGVCAGEQGLYIADTNSHRVALADWTTGAVGSLIAG